jgi:hypothetical protein
MFVWCFWEGMVGERRNEQKNKRPKTYMMGKASYLSGLLFPRIGVVKEERWVAIGIGD